MGDNRRLRETAQKIVYKATKIALESSFTILSNYSAYFRVLNTPQTIIYQNDVQQSVFVHSLSHANRAGKKE